MKSPSLIKGFLDVARVMKLLEILVEDFAYVIVVDQEVQSPRNDVFVWTPFYKGSILITVDAALKAKGCTLAFVARFCNGEFHAISKDGGSLSVEVVELEALRWVVCFAKEKR